MGFIYNSRNYLRLLNIHMDNLKLVSTTVEIFMVTQPSVFARFVSIYNSRNYLRLLNTEIILLKLLSTTVEII